MSESNRCYSCNGEGWIVCNRCGEVGSVSCFKCNGNGYVHYLSPGSSLPGSGIPASPRMFGNYRSFKGVGFSGRPCNKCDQTGSLPCLKCSTRGRLICRKCNGTGIFEISSQNRNSSPRTDHTSSTLRVRGTVKWFNKEKGFGFITPDLAGTDVHVNRKNLQGVDHLEAGDRVEFVCKQGEKGYWAAYVTRI